MRRPIAAFTATGRYTPERVVLNAEFEETLETSDQWIVDRTGIRERRQASDEETIAVMGTRAAQQALADAALTPDDLDAIVVGTASWDRLLPSQACDLQAVLGARNASAFDVGAACSGFLYASIVGEGLIAAGTAKNVLVVGAERLSRIMDPTDRSTAVLFGDGVGCALMQPAGNGGHAILSDYFKSDGTLAELLYRPGGGATEPASEDMLARRSYYIRMAGREVFRHAVRSMADACDQALQRAGLTGDDVDILIPHQANIRIIEATAKHASIPMDKVYVNVDRYGNTSAASIPIALDEAARAGKLEPGATVLLVGFGAGFTWASMVVRW